jgi:hypothetical protein
LNWNLGCSKLESFTRQLFRYTLHFVQHFAGLNQGDPVFHVTFTFALTYFKRLGSDWLVGKNPNPDLATTLDVSRHSSPGGFDLTRSKTTAPHCLQTVFAEADFATA